MGLAIKILVGFILSLLLVWILPPLFSHILVLGLGLVAGLQLAKNRALLKDIYKSL